MTNYGYPTIIFFLFISIGCASFNSTGQVDSDYNILLKEQIIAHHNAGFNTPFQQVIDDYSTFKRQLYLKIKEKYVNQFILKKFLPSTKSIITKLEVWDSIGIESQNK
jgi:hypothetical protein